MTEKMIKGQDLDELEKLAKSFIIDYTPFTPRQKEIWENIQAMELELKRIESKKRRVKNIINLLWKMVWKEGAE